MADSEFNEPDEKPSILDGLPRVFGHTYAVNACSKCSGYKHVSMGDPNWSWFYLGLAVCMTIPWSALLIFGPLDMPWYDFFGVLATELLLFYVAGFTSTVLLVLATVTGLKRNRPKWKCPECGGPVTGRGRYFETDEPPNWCDVLLTTVYLAINAAPMVAGIITALTSHRGR